MGRQFPFNECPAYATPCFDSCGNQGMALLAQMLDGYLLRSSSAILLSTVWSFVAL